MTANDPTLSVVICAYTEKRWDDICEAVQSLRDQDRRAEIVLVIDYNEALRKRAANAFADIRVVPNHYERGLSGARNTGIEMSTGDLIGFLDDDAVADPDWLSHLAALCNVPDVMGVTATVEPMWIGAKPLWLPDEFLWVIGCTYRGLPEETSEVRNLFGGAMMMKREVFARIGGFSSLIGRKGSFPLSCEDTELCIRASQSFASGKFLIEPRARIHHKIPTDRLTWKYFRVRCFAEGLSKALVASLAREQSFLKTEKTYVLRTLSNGIFKGILDALRADPRGLKRVSAIMLGLACACLGFAFGKFQAMCEKVEHKSAAPRLWLRTAAKHPTPIIVSE